MRRRLFTAVPLSALVLLAGCGGGDTEESSSSSSPTAATSSAAPSSGAGTSTAGAPDTEDDAAADAPPFPADTELDTAETQPGEGPTVVTDLRIGAHDGYDRVVFEVSGTAVPGWYVTYTDVAVAEGSGEPVDVPGEGTTFLQVSLRGITNPYEAPGVPEIARGATTSDTGTVQGVFYDSVYEGQAVAYIGVDGQTPFRVYSLTGPSRVVVEIQSP
ncbi:MAG: uncharacterized protein JWQ53_1414 [Klenkia sp.]|nr:uncharacterized protein [Klenkia sp.]